MNTAAARVAPEKADFRPVLLSPPYAGFLPEKLMAKMTYSEQLRHPNWQRRRLEILSKASFSCEWCGDTESTLNVHHKHYRKGRMAWEYEDHELTALCEPCHRQEHEHRAVLDEILNELSCDYAVGILAGYATRLGHLSPQRSADIFAAHKREFTMGYMAACIDCAGDPLDAHIGKLKKDMAQHPEWSKAFEAA